MLVTVNKTFRSRTGMGFVEGATINVTDAVYKRYKQYLTVIPTFEDMTIKELLDYASLHDIDLGGMKKKQDILEKIKGN